MTIPRSEQVDLESTKYYHCMNRCVRGSYLCGENTEGTTDYNQRKNWIVSRIKYLSEIFAIKICAYGVMNNHYHLVLYVDDQQVKNWTDSEVHQQWGKLYPKDAKQFALGSQEISKKINIWRERLCSISWYMRNLNELIAKLANKEDGCKGHFWEGRFKSQALLDEGAILSAMAYVDLNPIRAGIANTPEFSDFTSIQERLRHMTQKIKQEFKIKNQVKPQIDKLPQPKSLLPLFVGKSCDSPTINFNLSDYIELIEETGRVIREDKVGAIPENMSHIFERLGLLAIGWMSMVKSLQEKFSYLVGGASLISQFRKNNLTSSPKGLALARISYQA
tara:strand:+ start:143262 stop:144263 length:1002 start_codon:yes stop_codon:yes gene_type:complete